MKTKYTVTRIICALCILILLVSCSGMLLSCSQQTLSRREEKQIKQDLLALMELDNDYRQTHNIAPPSIEEIELRFLGKYNGYTVLYANSLYFGTDFYLHFSTVVEEEIATQDPIVDSYSWYIISIVGREDTLRNSVLLGYKDGYFYLLERLFIYGHIDYSQLIEIKNNFTHLSKESRKATVNYTKELQQEILSVYINKYEYMRGWEFNQRKPSISNSELCRLVAVIDNMVVVEIASDRASPVEITPITPAGKYNSVQIGEYTFESDYTLQVYRQGELVDLDQAYTLGWITDCELDDLYNLLRLPAAFEDK